MKKHNKILRVITLTLVMAVCVVASILINPLESNALPDERGSVMGFQITGLDAPKVGEHIDTDITLNNTTQLEVKDVAWYRSSIGDDYTEMDWANDTFALGRKYKAVIIIACKDGNYFPYDSMYVYVNGSFISSSNYTVSDDRETVTLEINYGGLYTSITALHIQNVKEPVFLEKLEDAEIIDGNFRVLENGWYDENGNEYSVGAIVDDIESYYEHKITLRANSGYRFNSQGSLNVRVNGELVTSYSVNRDRTEAYITLYSGNPKTGTVSELDFEIGTPIAGANPAFYGDTGSFYAYVDGEYEADGFYNGVLWYDRETGKALGVNDVFEAGKTYSVQVVLKCVSGLEFTPGTSNDDYTINGQKSTYFSSNAQSLRAIILETQYTVAEPIKQVQLNGVVEPVAGQNPNFNITSKTSGVEVTGVKWIKLLEGGGYNELNAASTFEMGESYRVLVNLHTTGDKTFNYNVKTGKAGYRVVCGDYVFTVNPEAFDAADDFHYGVSYATFACDSEIISYVGISNIQTPIAGEKPDFYCETDSNSFYAEDGIYEGTVNGVKWIDYTDGGRVLGKDDVFLPGHKYRLLVYLKAQGESSFAFDPKVGITVQGEINGTPGEISMVTEAHDTMCIFVDYQCPKALLYEFEITIPTPVVGEKPDFTQIRTDKVFSDQSIVDTVDYTFNGIAWTDAGKDGLPYGKDEVFSPNHKILCIIALSPTDSYTFADEVDVYVNGEKCVALNIFEVVLVTFEFTPKTCDRCTLEFVRGTAPTCTEEGFEHSYRCTKCGQIYKDVNGEEPVYVTDEWGVVPPKGHRYGDATEELSFDGAHLAFCLDCGEECRVDCTLVDKEVYGPSQFSRLDAIVTSCSECYRVYSVEVEEWVCEGEGHALREWMPVTSLGEHTGVHFRSCECGAHTVEDECNYSVVFVKGPNEYLERDVMLYVCDLCGGESFVPVEMPFDQEYKQDHVDYENGIILDFHEKPDISIHPSVEITIDKGDKNDISDYLIDEIETRFGEYTSIYVWFNINARYGDYPVAPGGEYVITVNDPIKYDEHTKTRVCIISNDGRIDKVVEPTVNGESVTFTTDTFGQFVVVGDEDPMFILTYQLKGGGQGTQPGDMFYPGDSFVLEDCTLIPDEGFRFKCWEIDGVEYNPGDTIIVNKDTYVYTVWERIPKEEHQHTYVDGVCECGNWDPDYEPEPPEHRHVFVDGVCECGEIDPEFVPDHEHSYVDGKCECGAVDPEFVPDHEHSFVDGRCECGATDPDYIPDDPTDPDDEGEKDHSKCLEEASGWKRFWNAIGNFFRRIFSKTVKCVCGDKVDKDAYTEFKNIFKQNRK